MPEIDKNYLAGLYLDEITLDVMPQEYIDAALEVKLRYDACAPRAGYNCVQDRRVKGGFYYRKAPKGQGINALPPSKLERALARSQEQDRPRSEMGFLSKAAIGTGLAIGGLALTGAVVNAGRSGEPYQEPVRQRPAPAPSNNARNIGLGVGAAATVGLGVGAAVLNKPAQPVNTDINKVEPIVNKGESQPSTEPSKSTPSQAEAEGKKEAESDIQAIKEVTSVLLPDKSRAYENALAVKYTSRDGETLAKARVKAASYTAEGDENFIRVSDLRDGLGRGSKSKKATEAAFSKDMQETYDLLQKYGLEDSVEFRTARSRARGKEGQELTSNSANPFTINVAGEEKRYGEIRFTRSAKEIKEAIASKLKAPEAVSQPPQESAEPTVEKPKPLESVSAVGDRTPESQKFQAQAALGRAIRMGATEPDGYVNQSSLFNDKVLKNRLAGNDPVSLIDDGINEGRIQTKKVGRNTYVRDIDAIPLKDFVAEAKGLTDVKDKDADRRVKDLREALAYKERTVTNDAERVGIADLRAAIDGIKVQEAQERKKPDKPKSGNGGVRGAGADKPTSLEDAKKKGLVKEETDETVTAIPISDEEVSARTKEDEKKKLDIKQKNSMQSTGVPTRSKDTYMSPRKIAEQQAQELQDELESGEDINVVKFNKKVMELRESEGVKNAIKVDRKHAQIDQDYNDAVENLDVSSDLDLSKEMVRLEKEKQQAFRQRELEIYKEFGIPDPIKKEKKNKVQGSSSSDTLEPPAPQQQAPAANANEQELASPNPPIKEEKRSQSTTPPISKPPVTPPKSEVKARGAAAKTAKEKASQAQKDARKQEDKERAEAAVSTASSNPAPSVDLKTLQVNINKMEATAKTLENTLARIQSGKRPLQASQSALSNMGIDVAGFGALDPAKQISKLQKTIAYQRKQIQKKQKEGQDFVDSLTKNDAIAPSETYLEAYWQTRNQFRRAS